MQTMKALKSLEKDCKELAVDKLIYATPSEYGLITREINYAVQSYQNAEINVDIFPGHYSYPTTITWVGRIVLIFFCGMHSITMSSHYEAPWFFVPMCYQMSLAVAFGVLYKLSTDLENPFGIDSSDINLKKIGYHLCADVASLFEIDLKFQDPLAR